MKRTSSLIKNLIENLDLFTNFEEKIDKYKYDKSQQICNTSSLLENNKEKNSNYDVMYEKYVELSNLSTEYYTEAEDVYKTMKEELFTNINKINNFLISCEEVTYDTIINEYNKLKDEFNGIEETQDKTNEQILIPVSTFNKTDSYITMETTIQNYLVHNKITVDLLYDNDSKTPKVIGRLENNVKPNIFNIDYYSTFGGKDKIGKIIEVNFNKISSYTNITFDSSFNNLSIVTNFNFDKYKYKTQYYEKTTNSTIKKIFGIPTIVNVTIVSYNKTLEENIDIDPKNKTIVENYIF